MACCNETELQNNIQELCFVRQPIRTNKSNTGIASTTVEVELYAFGLIKTTRGSPFFGDKAIIGEQATHTILVDYTEDLQVVNSGYFVKANNKIYRIKSVVNVDEQNLQLKFYCILQNVNIL